MNNSRVLILIIGVFIFFLAIGVKLFSIQILKSEELKYLAERQQTGIEKTNAERGPILPTPAHGKRTHRLIDGRCGPYPLGQKGPLSPPLSPSKGERGQPRLFLWAPRFKN